MTKKLHYALKRRSDGQYINAGVYGRFDFQKTPFPLRRLSTARSHRARLFATPTHDPSTKIDIEEIWIDVEPGNLVDEDENVTNIVAQCAKKLHDIMTASNPHIRHHQFIGGFCMIFDDLLRSKKSNATMKYAVIAKVLPELPLSELRETVNFVVEQKVFLLKNDTDLVLLKLHVGFEADFVYNIFEQRFIES